MLETAEYVLALCGSLVESQARHVRKLCEGVCHEEASRPLAPLWFRRCKKTTIWSVIVLGPHHWPCQHRGVASEANVRLLAMFDIVKQHQPYFPCWGEMHPIWSTKTSIIWESTAECAAQQLSWTDALSRCEVVAGAVEIESGADMQKTRFPTGCEDTLSK
jgi:hypothetical protein